MARVVVDVMLKPEILDPQGQAVANALPRLGVDEVASVRVGRRIELEFEGPPDLAKVNQLADRLLANPVIEDYTVTVDGEPAAPAGGRAASRRAGARRAASEPARESRPETASPAETVPAPPLAAATEPPVAPAAAEPAPEPVAADQHEADRNQPDRHAAGPDPGDPDTAVAPDTTVAPDTAGGERTP